MMLSKQLIKCLFIPVIFIPALVTIAEGSPLNLRKAADLLKTPSKHFPKVDSTNVVVGIKSLHPNTLSDSLITRRQIRSKRFVQYGGRWRSTNLTYKILNYPKKLKKADVDAVISKAFKVWSDNSSLTFTAKKSGTANIEISFVKSENGDPFDGPGGVVARSYFPSYGGDVYFDIDERWTIANPGGIDLFRVAAHEFGHALGLDHSNNKSALMSSTYFPKYAPEFKLDSDDVLGIQTLYGKGIIKSKSNKIRPIKLIRI